jgi:hypothetical protein
VTMTEEEWLSANDPPLMLDLLKAKASKRKLVLFCAECCAISRRHRSAGRKVEEDWADVECIVRLADGADNLEEVRRRWGRWHFGGDGSPPEVPFEWCSGFAQRSLLEARARSRPTVPTVGELVRLFHEVFGNPFRPVAVDPSWLTTDVRLLADGIYEERAFDRLPILADALMDAGCANDALLGHLRSDGPHVRGCWALDLLLGKG